MQGFRIISYAVAGALLLSSSTVLAKNPVPITECDTHITEPGKYVVTQDLFCVGNQQGIMIVASDVTLDLKGHTITCDAENTEPEDYLVGAVLVGDWPDSGLRPENVTIKNGTVTGCDDGVIFFFTQGGKVRNIHATGNYGGGIALIVSTGITVKKNIATGNNNGIGSFVGTGNTITHNTITESANNGIDVWGETGSTLSCNTSDLSTFGVSVGPYSSGNQVKGNFISNAFFVGVNVWGYRDGPDYFEPIPWDNVIEKNLVQGSGLFDLDEVVFDAIAGWPYVDEEAGCQNTWKENEYGSAWGPANCFAPSVILDDDDICALDDD